MLLWILEVYLVRFDILNYIKVGGKTEFILPLQWARRFLQ